jgi:pimeloyl-ACP methyl ester carboxylesterase
VLFDTGQGDSTLVWRLVQGEMAKVTQACAYDRAGIGFSDPRNGASDAKAIVADIHALLIAAKVKTPILYVAHSGSGLYGVLLEATHPHDLAGAVLVEPAFADQWNSISKAGKAAGAPQAASDTLLAALRAQVPRMNVRLCRHRCLTIAPGATAGCHLIWPLLRKRKTPDRPIC